jgi:hypothetical protein
MSARRRHRIDHGAPKATPDEAADSTGLGRRSTELRTQAVLGAAWARSCFATAFEPAPSGACDVARAPGRPLPQIGADLRGTEKGVGGIEPRGLSRHSFLGSTGSRPSHRRGRLRPRLRERHTWTNHALRNGGQSRRSPPRPRLESPVSGTRARDPERGPSGHDLRPPELPKAPSRASRNRPAQLRCLVRRVVAHVRAIVLAPARRDAADLAGLGRLAPRGRATSTFEPYLALALRRSPALSVSGPRRRLRRSRRAGAGSNRTDR